MGNGQSGGVNFGGIGDLQNLKDMKIDLKIDPDMLNAMKKAQEKEEAEKAANLAGLVNSQTHTGNPNYANNNVPGITIKPGWDAWKTQHIWEGKRDMITSDERLGGGDTEAQKCGYTGVVAKDFLTTDGKQHKTKHRYINCGGTPLTPNCNNCDQWPKQKDGPKGPLYAVRSPIGSKLQIWHGYEVGQCMPEKKEDIDWGRGDYSRYPKKLPEEVATGCAGGGSLGRGEYVKTLNGYKIQHDDQNGGWKTDDCYLGGFLKSDVRNSTSCLQSEISPDTYCQMGDYIVSTDLCKDKCSGISQDNIPKGKEYCEYGFDRLCRKRKGDPLKRTGDGKAVINSQFDYLKDDPGCKTFCGTAEDKKCRDIKDDVCSRNKDDWIKTEWIPEYCRVHWKSQPNRVAMDKVCKDELMNPDSPQNLFSGKGCGKLCMGEGTDVDTEWCKFHKGQYCLKSDKNMLTDECYHFCSEFPDLCDNYLSGDKGMCNRLGIKSQADLDKPVPGTLQNYSDWCGCMMPRKFYQDYADNIDKQFNSAGYSIQGQIDLSPECMYPQCKQGSIMTKKQQTDKKNGMCTDCVQIMLQSLDGGSFINNNFASEQSATCGNIKQNALAPGDWHIQGTINKFIKVFDNKSYCTYIDDIPNVSNTIDKIPDGNAPMGLCELTPGFYKVRESGNIVRVHDDGKYCEFPLDKFDDEKFDFKIIDSMSPYNTREDQQCSGGSGFKTPATSESPATSEIPTTGGTAESNTGNASMETDDTQTDTSNNSDVVIDEEGINMGILVGSSVGGLIFLMCLIAFIVWLRNRSQ